MSLTAENSIVVQQTIGLCQAILDAPEFQDIRQRISAFLSHDQVQNLYRLLSEKRDLLQQKQEQGQALSNEEIADFEKHRHEFVNNPIARGFLDAQEEMHEIKKMVTQYVTKTMELGHVPEAEDLQVGSCGAGCGCH
jgi:cell fate (sporulation/competence/biofilm development) regulator YlbF (YheA/YmcA/DUF963 family)